ncbi:TetR/AcrR family transcriptional regulator [Nocardia sp. XZ_19_385]|uniref:TetR/AcrR family transcriptional regulator n=1 Tax=Nocardia sp. XZ_19_385 TaxID=2769488 RepID=UPI001890A212|nr:TetR/AcrR family transcriptional regulator [Nocardia sp. XZ_19_385]
MAADDLGLRERKKQATRLALSAATIQLSVERGWSNVSVEDIAAAADVSVRTFRNYFANKGEAVAFRQLERMRQIGEELRARPVEEPLWTAIPAAVRERFPLGHDLSAHGGHSSGQRERQWVEGVRRMLAEPAVQAAILEVNTRAQRELAAAIAERTGTDAERDLYPKLVAAAVGTATAVAIEHSQAADPPLPLLPLLTEALDQLAAGLPEPSPRRKS